LEPLRILIADDEPIIRLDLRQLLEAMGHAVVAEAGDGASAVSFAKQLQPNLCILDVKMPVMDGIEAAAAISRERIAPVLILTAYGQGDLIEKARDAGVFAYLVKPFREGDLLPAIEAARARHAELAELRAESESLREALESRKAIERAKGVLMDREGISEQEAFERMRRASQKTGKPLREIAEALLAAFQG
jgi:response regulator NasT